MRADLERAVRRAIRSVLLPVVETPEFQARLAAALAVEMGPPAAMPEPSEAVDAATNPAGPDEAPQAVAVAAPQPKRGRQRVFSSEEAAQRRRQKRKVWDAKYHAKKVAERRKGSPEAAGAETTPADTPVPAAAIHAPAEATKPVIRPPVPARPQTPEAIAPRHLRAWLADRLYSGGLSKRDAEDRVALMTHDQVLEDANRRCAQTGARPFRLVP